MDYNYTAKMEKQLDEIESGKVDYVDMLKKFYPKYKQELTRHILIMVLICEVRKARW